MARLKTTVNWFPHQVKHKKTMHIIRNRFGNNGYAFWFSLLEMLGNTEDHFYDYRDVLAQEFLAAETRVSAEVCTEILDLLAKLDAIDAELWAIKVVWCQNFVDGLGVVYAKRDVDLPVAPRFLLRKPDKVSTADIPVTESDIPSPESPHSRHSGDGMKQSRVEESIEEKKHVSFSRFWDLSPPRHGKKRLKSEAKNYWMKHITNGKAEKILIAVKNYADSKDVKQGIGIRDPIRFLKKDYWREWLEPEEDSTVKPAGPKKSLDQIVAERNKKEGVC